MALLNAMVFVLGGVVLVTVNWTTTSQAIQDNSSIVMSATATPLATPDVPVPQTSAAPSPAPSAPVAVPVQGSTEDNFATFKKNVLTALLTRSLLILLATSALSLLATTWVAQRALSRIGRVTSAAQRIGQDSLHARLGLVGPDDEVKELADTFDAMLDRLDRSFTGQSRFTAHASHELRTPLTIQRTALEIPLAQGRVPAGLVPDVHRALAATERIEQLLGALLTLARGESDTRTFGPADLSDLARDALAEVLAEADDTGVTVNAQLGSAPLTGDAVLLAQLVTNLITNAVRHNTPGGSVHVTTGTTLHGAAHLEVTNTGPVIDTAGLPLLFEPFQRGAARRKGSGLGLSVVRAVTTTHRGTLTSRPNPGGGLNMRVELPGTFGRD
ncbi:sensor histidine kinase [Streptomyces mirabilis]